jgi:glycosyltransferase involved in cell wall biosynthesis
MVLSIIICTYNRVNFLKLCVDSILDQIQGNENIELIVIDNNSNDNTPEFLQKYITKQLIYFLEKKQGLSYARNKGIQVAKGKNLAFVDDDATISENWVKSLITELKKKKYKHIYGGPIYPVFETECPKWIDKKYFNRKFKDSDGYLDKLTANDGFSGGNMCIPKEIFDRIGNFDVTLGMQGNQLGLGEESELFYRILNNDREVKLYNIQGMSINHFEAKIKVEKEYLKNRISIGAEQFTSRLLEKKTFLTWIYIFGKLIKQSLQLPLNYVFSFFDLKYKFNFLKNIWIIKSMISRLIK